MHRQGRVRINVVRPGRPGRAQKVTDDGDVGIENLRSGCRAALDRQLTSRRARSLRAGRDVGCLRRGWGRRRGFRRWRRLRWVGLELQSLELAFVWLEPFNVFLL